MKNKRKRKKHEKSKEKKNKKDGTKINMKENTLVFNFGFAKLIKYVI